MEKNYVSIEAHKNYRVIIVEDNQEMRKTLTQLLKETNWKVDTLNGGEDIRQLLKNSSPDVILSDVHVSEINGFDLTNKFTDKPMPPVVRILASGNIPGVVKIMPNEAYGVHRTLLDPKRLLNELLHAAKQHRQALKIMRLNARLNYPPKFKQTLLGNTDCMKALNQDIYHLSHVNIPVMFLGETGSGKELAARTLHNLSSRSQGRFIAVNCAAIPIEKLERLQFGPLEDLCCLSTDSGPGTIFLDEIGTCPIEIQAKLCRIIETQELGILDKGTYNQPKFRIISASSEDLNLAVDKGTFRRDLLFRLNTVVLNVPPLRDRCDDIPLLYNHFMEQQTKLYKMQIPEFTADDAIALLSHRWLGNVRELRHVAERRILAARSGQGSVSEAIQHDSAPPKVSNTLREIIATLERQLIGTSIKAHQGQMDTIAEALGISRRTLNNKIVKLGLN